MTVTLPPKIQDGKTLSVASLPECPEKAELTRFCINAATAKICVLAVRDGDFFSVYYGYPTLQEIKERYRHFRSIIHSCTKVHSVADVKRLGAKLPEAAARQLFPDWSDIVYR